MLRQASSNFTCRILFIAHNVRQARYQFLVNSLPPHQSANKEQFRTASLGYIQHTQYFRSQFYSHLQVYWLSLHWHVFFIVYLLFSISVTAVGTHLATLWKLKPHANH